MTKSNTSDMSNKCTTADRKATEVKSKEYKVDILWENVTGFVILHLLAFYGIYLVFARAYLATTLWALFIIYLCQVGVTVGAHRLFTHRAFRATATLKVFLLACHTMAGQKSLLVWARDHRLHHKYTDTDADPHNATRGFFFSHIGWLVVRRHPDVFKFGRMLSISDLLSDPYVMLQSKYYRTIYFFLGLLMPVAVPCYFWNETLTNSFMIAYALRYAIVLNGTFLVNSAAHLYGMKPYDKNMNPGEVGVVSYLTGGEGWHNFHHCYPWDYRAAEFGPRFNSNEVFIEFCERLGLASHLRSVSKSVLKKKVLRSGDGSHPVWGGDAAKHTH